MLIPYGGGTLVKSAAAVILAALGGSRYVDISP
jgi:hypothetical protein